MGRLLGMALLDKTQGTESIPCMGHTYTKNLFVVSLGALCFYFLKLGTILR